MRRLKVVLEACIATPVAKATGLADATLLLHQCRSRKEVRPLSQPTAK